MTECAWCAKKFTDCETLRYLEGLVLCECCFTDYRDSQFLVLLKKDLENNPNDSKLKNLVDYYINKKEKLMEAVVKIQRGEIDLNNQNSTIDIVSRGLLDFISHTEIDEKIKVLESTICICNNVKKSFVNLL